MSQLQVGQRCDVYEVLKDYWKLGLPINSFLIGIEDTPGHRLLHNGFYKYMTRNEVRKVGTLIVKEVK